MIFIKQSLDPFSNEKQNSKILTFSLILYFSKNARYKAAYRWFGYGSKIKKFLRMKL